MHNLGNLQAMAAGLIPQQEVGLIRFNRVETSETGYQVPTYKRPVKITGSFQPMAAQDAQKLGLNFRQVHATLFTRESLKLAGPGTPPDKIKHAGREYEVIGVADWSTQNGWASYTLVAI